MSLSAAVVKELVNAGLSGEALVMACQRIEEADTEPSPIDIRRANDAERQRRYRASKSTGGHVTSRDKRDAPLDKEKPPQTPEKKTQPPHQKETLKGFQKGTPKPTPRTELLAVLDAEHADAVIEYRQRIKTPLTARAGKMLAKRFAECPDPNAAADAMMVNGWRGFESEWVKNRTQAAGSAQNGPLPKLDWSDPEAVRVFRERLAARQSSEGDGQRSVGGDQSKRQSEPVASVVSLFSDDVPRAAGGMDRG